MSNRSDAHLADVEDGAGCTEIWEKLSEERDSKDAVRSDERGEE